MSTPEILSPPLKRRAQHGAVLVALQNNASEAISFVFSVILARILLPEDFGLIGMMAIVLTLTQRVTTGLLLPSLMQRKEIDDRDCSTIFYAGLVLALLTYIILYICAPLIGRFYGYPSLTDLFRVGALRIVLIALAGIPAVKFARELRFGPELVANCVSALASGVLATVLALAGLGVWSLVALSLSARLFSVIIMWAYTSWRPSLTFSWNTLKTSCSYGSRLVAHNLSESIFFNLHGLVFGKIYTADILGFFNRGRAFPLLVSGNFVAPVNRVIFPSFARLQAEPGRLGAAYGKSFLMLLFLSAPAMLGLAALAHPLVLVLLGEKWLPAVPYLRIACVLAALNPFRRLAFNVFKSIDRIGVGIKLQVVTRAASLIALACTLRFGPMAMLCAEGAVSSLATLAYLHVAARMVGLRWSTMLPELVRIVTCALAMLLGVVWCTTAPLAPWLSLVAGIPCGAAIYSATVAALRVGSALEFIEYAHHLRPKSPLLRRLASWARISTAGET